MSPAARQHPGAAQPLGLRARNALERLARGERNLARLATDTGSRTKPLCRVLHQKGGGTPCCAPPGAGVVPTQWPAERALPVGFRADESLL